MARRKRIYISREQKEEIIKGLIETNCNIKLLAEKYQVTVRTLSKWRSDYYKAEEGKQPKPEGHFVEVQVGSDIKKSHLLTSEKRQKNKQIKKQGRKEVSRFKIPSPLVVPTIISVLTY